jgi:hypothetical protein
VSWPIHLLAHLPHLAHLLDSDSPASRIPWGSVIRFAEIRKEVKCEACGCEYFYLLYRETCTRCVLGARKGCLPPRDRLRSRALPDVRLVSATNGPPCPVVEVSRLAPKKPRSPWRCSLRHFSRRNCCRNSAPAPLTA